MSELDLVEDDPEEYEGRIVRWWGAEYVIGPFIAEGAERIVHQLTNVRSGLSLHFIKILRDQESAPSPTLRMLEAYKTVREDGAPVVEDPELVHAHGGWFELDEAATIEEDPHFGLMAEARVAYTNGNVQGAVEKCGKILALSPWHTEALQYSAAVFAGQNDLANAIKLGMKILEIEPNVRPYRFMVMEWAASAGLLDLFRVCLRELKEKWPGERRADSLAAEVALARGCPQEAQNLYLGDSVELQRRVAAEVDASARARKFLSQVVVDRQGNRLDEALNFLTSAYAEYPKDPDIAVNYGLTLLRSGDWRRSYDVLAAAVPAAPRLHKDGAIAAMIICLVNLEEYERAAGIVEFAAARVAAPDGDISYWDLPTVPILVCNDQVVMPRKSEIPFVIDVIIDHLNGSAIAVPPSLPLLKELYEKAPDYRRET